tara:strand:+ start:2554 stop:3225 length:672 start_codon:yes stop_codon:yes gene_type:complete
MKKTILAAAIGLMTISSAHAELIESDYESTGDNQAVFDTNTNLTWLDLDLTVGMSIEQAEESFEGWRVATYDEVFALFTSFFGYDPVETESSGYQSFDSGSQFYDEGMLWGELFSSNLAYDYSDPFTVVNYGYYDIGNNQARMMGTQVINSGNTVRIFDTNYNYTVQHDITSVLTGVYLVQEETSATVPEPDTDPDTDVPADVPVPFGFAALGLGLLAFGRRK